MNNNSNSNKNTHHQQHHHHHHYSNEFSLFVGDLPDDCSDDDLQRLFQSKFKSVKRVQIIRHEDGKSRGFGFIRFEDKNDFHNALSEEMRIGNKLLRLDTAHRSFKNRSRYPSINSSSSNSSHQPNHHSYNNTNNSNNNSNSNSNNGSGGGLHHHHHHHHNQSHHHHQHHQNQAHQQHLNSAQQPQQGQKNKTLAQDQLVSSQQSHHSGSADGISRVNNSLHVMNTSSSASSTVHHHSHAHHHQQHNSSHNAHMNLFNPSQQKNSQHQQTAGTKSPKQQSQPNLPLGGDDAASQSQTKQSLASPQMRPNLMQPQQQQPQQQQQPPSTQQLTPVGGSAIGLPAVSGANITAVSTQTVTSMSNNESSSQSSSGIVTNQSNISATGPTPVAHDYRGFPQTAMLDNPHLLGTADPTSVVPPSGVYGHIYPYGPPSHFGYMPPPQPNPVIPISAGPPLPPNQGSSSTVVGPHSLPTASATRYGNASHQQHHHPPAHLAGVPDASAMNTMTAGVQASHQTPFYYYYPNPFYFDQSGAGAPPNMYHPQTLHPPFFALPNPAFMPNAHTYTNQQQTQPPTAPQSEATTTLVNQSQPPQPPQSHQQQVNIRTRDIDAPIE